MKLRDKTALVTGASTGIGRALALGLAHEGAQVVVNFHDDREGAEAVVSEINASGRPAFAVQADISHVGDIRRMFATVQERLGALDVLINNAAVTGWGDLRSITEETWDLVLDTNLKGTFFCSQQAVPLMKAAGGGAIIKGSLQETEIYVR